MRTPMPERTFSSVALISVLEKAALLGPRAVVAFDLDSTLLDNRPRQLKIIHEFGMEINHEKIKNCRMDQVDAWSLEWTLRYCGLSPKEVDALLPDLTKFWQQRFFSKMYCAVDIPMPGAVEYVNKLKETGCKIAYSTGRDINMKEGSEVCLHREGFPLPDEKQVYFLLKPTLEMPDDDWKEQLHGALREKGQLIAAFDNEPKHINTYYQSFPDVYAIHLYTDESGRGIPVLPQIPSVYHFLY